MPNSHSDDANVESQQDATFSLEDAVEHAVHHARQIVVAVVGGTVVLAGIVMLVTPGPAMVLIPAGLSILAVEFAWARRLLKRVRSEIREHMGRQSTADCVSKGPNDEGGKGADDQPVKAHCQN